ncbi:uncharacterized protein B0I36DRAFT_264958 [Microdochium trichocladiopsis]|uniref:Armadillo-type protein n=1 Tax=Microdochium trichocladiopsis TaxID=1682393 RepID=A0A9P8YET6_9PEZI|nr:uncharacterized protein B0I36DRAFT_264958 [Microdochium trichocladiopsis]KAH7035688.1 hypothetical protein B0I36DRAFT_264958 [Microdochium trichocladiopsis]
MALQAVYEAVRATQTARSTTIDPNLDLSEVTIQQVDEFLRHHGEKDRPGALLTALAVLEARPDLVHDQSSREPLAGIINTIAQLMTPTLTITQDGDTADYQNVRQSASIGIDLVHLITSQDDVELSAAATVALIAYTDATVQWSDPDLAESAQEVLDAHFDHGNTSVQQFILEDVLHAFIRPLFSKSRPATVTASGRKAEFVQTSRYDTFNADAEANKPWKYQSRYAITVFAWTVDHADRETIQKNWHQFTPVLLTLLDETDTPLKLKSLDIFKAFWSKCPPDLMQQTGLAQVFEDAIFPAVLYLPSLTPEDESVQVLNATYSALFAIAGIDADYNTSKPQSDPKFSDKQRKLVHKIVREGILTAYQHSSEYIRIVEVLCKQLQLVVNGMGIFAVKHLKDAIPMLSAIISDPFATVHPASLIAALDALRAVQNTCWPRVPNYANNIIKMLMLCWLRIEEDEHSNNSDGQDNPEKDDQHRGAPNTVMLEASVIKEKLKHNARMLDAILTTSQEEHQNSDPVSGNGEKIEESRRSVGGGTLSERVRPLVEKHRSLGELFGP